MPSLVVNVTVSVNGSAVVVGDGASVWRGVVVSATEVDVSEDPDTGDAAEVVDDRVSSPGPHPERKPTTTIRATKVGSPLMSFSIRLSHPAVAQ